MNRVPNWSEVELSQLNPGTDLAAEHYHWQKLAYLKCLTTLGGPTIDVVASPNTKTIPPADGALVFDLSSARHHVLQVEDAQTEERTSGKKRARTGDVLVSRLRSYLRQIALVPRSIGSALVSSEFIVLRPKGQEGIGFLVPYLLCEQIQTVLAWSQDGNEHPRFGEHVLLTLPISPYVMSNRVRLNAVADQISDLVTEARDSYSAAEEILVKALGLDSTPTVGATTFTAPLSATSAVGRLDADYFSPLMQEMLQTLSRSGQRIRDVAPISKRRFRPESGTSFNYISISDIDGTGRAQSKPMTGSDAPSRATWEVRKEDVISTLVRPIRRLSAIISEKQDCHVCTSGFTVLTPRAIQPELLLAYLRLPHVCLLLDLLATASMYPAITPDDLANFPLALPPTREREKVVALVRKSIELRNEATEILNETICDLENRLLEAV